MQQDLKVKILGCGDAFASGGRFNTCFYVHNQQNHIIVDCGASAIVSMKKYNVPLPEIEYIILSHLHGDHFGGIPFFLLDAQYNQKRGKSLSICGPEGTEDKVQKLSNLLYPGTDPKKMNFPVHFKEYESEKRMDLGSFSLTAFPVIHSEPSNPHGLRINFQDKVFAFSGDTEWTDKLFSISENADLFICESNFYDTKAPNHLDYKTLIKHKNRFSCKKIILNHLGEEMLSRLKELEIDCAEDGQVITI